MRYRILDQNGLNFVTFTVVGWIDLFTRHDYSDIILDSLRFCQKNKGLQVFGYVIMSSHLHLILATEEPSGLSRIIQSFKSYSAKEILKRIKDRSLSESRQEWLLYQFKHHAKQVKNHSEYQIWQRGNHPFLLYGDRMIRQKLYYIHLNPVKAKIVAMPEHYLYSSASNYVNGKGLLDVVLLDNV